MQIIPNHIINYLKQNLNMRKISTLLFAAVMAFQMKAQTVVDVVVGSPDHTILETAVIEAGLAGTLSGPGPFTVFAPTDAAFNALPAGVLDALLADPSGDLTTILTYHVVGETFFSGDLVDGTFLPTLQGESLSVSVGGTVQINNATVTFADIATDNGIVHVIDAVLLPEAILTATVYDIIENNAQLNTLEAAINAAGLAETLSGAGPFTVFAPTDAAFENLPAGLLESLLNDPDGLLTEILFYHVVSGAVESSSLEDGQVVTTVNGDVVVITISEGLVFVNDAQVVVTDLQADNGIVHIIDAVLVPGPVALPTIFEIVAGNEVHNTLEAAILAAGLDQDLSAEGAGLTLFAPTDDAFNALPAGTVEALLEDPAGLLTDILLYHVVGSVNASSSLADGQEIITLNGLTLTVTIDNGVFINEAQVILADIEASNGIVHVIDAVLVPAEESNTVWDVIVNSEEHNTLEAAVNAAELAGALSGPGPLTVFAPTDAAFNNLPEGTLEALLADPSGLLTEILVYHVAEGAVTSDMLMDGQQIVTLQGQSVTVTLSEGLVFINDAQVIFADIIASNGVVHVIDAVLTPAQPLESSVWDIIANSADHNTLEVAIEAAGLVETLDFPGTFTVFAPTDDAFNALPAGTIDALLADPGGLLTEILLYHVVGSVALSTDLEDGQEIVTLNGASVTVTFENGNVFINDAQVILADLTADNGVVHVIDVVLIPQAETNTVLDIIVNSPDHNTLEAAVIAAELDGTLAGPGPFTVFAPTDAAFNALPAGTVDALLADPTGLLQEILLYHVVNGAALSSSLSDGDEIETVLGPQITITINADGVFVNDAEVIVFDIIADNGVVHVIDAVLSIPEPFTVWDVIQNSADHTTLEAAISVAGLDTDLDNEEASLTVFAPTDEAFSNLPAGTVIALLGNIPMLTEILLYHVVGATALSTDLADGQTIETLQGENVTVTINGDGVFINDAQVILADIIADNGVVHVIDVVLSPPSNVEESSSMSVSVYPNPANDVINVSVSGMDRVMFEVVSMTGARVMEGTLNGSNNQLNVSNLNNGVYSIRLINGENVSVSSFIKQ
jgi:uncharacterized surface protein with fasciclin (FAS1) repeats